MEPHGSKARCVVWRERGVIVPAQLERALVGSGCVGVHADDEFEAVSQLCRPASGGGPNVLLLVEPATMKRVGEMLDVVERYVPDAVLWAYESHPAERIRAVTEEERAAWRARPKAWLEGGPEPEPRAPVAADAPHPIAAGARSSRQVKLSAGPRLRLAGEGPGEPAEAAAKDQKSDNGVEPAPQGPDKTPAPAGNVLTDEELSMLLALERDAGHN